jgi:hypothetical protein
VAVENCPVEVQSDEANHCRFKGFRWVKRFRGFKGSGTDYSNLMNLMNP